MNIKGKIGVAAATAGLAVAGMGLLVQAASATSSSHAIHLTAVQLKSTQVNSTTFVQAEKDLQGGKVTGYDAVNCTFHNATHKASCDGSFARRDGQLYVHATVGPTGHGTGKVTGRNRCLQGRDRDSHSCARLFAGTDQDHDHLFRLTLRAGAGQPAPASVS